MISHSLHGYIKTVNSKNVTLEDILTAGLSLLTSLFKIHLTEIIIGEILG